MQNAMMDLMKQFNDNAMNTAKRVGELNMKTFETLSTKQTELMTSYFEMGSKSVEVLSKAKNPQEAATMQQETLKAAGEKWATGVRETTDLLSSTRDEWVAISEEAAQYVAENAEKATELNKQLLTENMSKATEAVEKAVAKATELTEEALAATKDAADKATVAGKEVAEKTVAATKKAAADLKVAA